MTWHLHKQKHLPKYIFRKEEEAGKYSTSSWLRDPHEVSLISNVPDCVYAPPPLICHSPSVTLASPGRGDQQLITAEDILKQNIYFWCVTCKATQLLFLIKVIGRALRNLEPDCNWLVSVRKTEHEFTDKHSSRMTSGDCWFQSSGFLRIMVSSNCPE